MILCYAMLCYAMLCYAMLCYAMLCYAMLCYAMLCYAMLCYAMLCYAMLCYAMLCYAMLCYAMLCYAMLCYAMLMIFPELLEGEASARRPQKSRQKEAILGGSGDLAVSRNSGPFLGVLTIRILIYWGLYSGPEFSETPI